MTTRRLKPLLVICLADVILGLLGAGIAYGVEGASGIVSVAAATGVSLVVAIGVFPLLSKCEVSVAAVVLSTFVRVGVTCLLVGAATWRFEELRTVTFLLMVTCGYLLNLALETRFALMVGSPQVDQSRLSEFTN